MNRKGVITNGKLVVLIDDTEAKDSYTVTFSGSKASTYNTSTLTVVDSAIAKYRWKVMILKTSD